MRVYFNTDKVRRHLFLKDKTISHFSREIGVKVDTLHSVMMGKSNPRIELAYRISRGMGCTVDDLLTADGHEG